MSEHTNAANAFGVSRFQRLVALRAFPAYAVMPTEEVVAIAELTREMRFSVGEHLLREGTPVDTFFFIVRGEVELRRKGRVIRRMGRRTVVGGVAALAQDPTGYDCVALEDTVVLALAARDSEEIMEDNFTLLRGILRGVSGEVLAARRRAEGDGGFAAPSHEDVAYPEEPLDLVERMRFLRTTMTFAQGQLDAIADLAREVRERRFAAGEVLFEEGQLQTTFYFPVHGVVEGTTENGKTFCFGPGDTVGGLDALALEPRWFSARAATPLVTVEVEVDDLHDVLEDDFEMALGMVRAFATGMMSLYDRGLAAPEA